MQQPDEKPQMFYKPKINPIMPPTMRCIEKPQAPLLPQQNFQQCRSSDDFFNRNLQQLADLNSNPFVMNRGGDITMSTTMPTDLVNQMMNSSYQQSQQKYRANCFYDGLTSNQSFYDRNLKFQQQQQQMQSMKRDFYNSSGMSSTSSSSLSAYEANMQQQYSMMTPSSSFYTRFDPPKPDTPPSKPLWLDPVWNCDGNFDNRPAGASNSANFGTPDSVSREIFMQIFSNSYFDFFFARLVKGL